MAITLDDIAKIAKVSPSTVSRVISNNPSISKATREKVLKIMDEMNFQPNIVARSLANNSTKTIGVVLASRTEGALSKAFRHPLFPDMLGGLSLTAYKNGYNILLSSLNKYEDDKQKIRELVKGGLTDGIIYYFSRVNDPIIAELKSLNSPFVVIGRPVDDNEVNWVDNDNYSLSYHLTEQLIKRGRKKIAFVGASSNFLMSVDRLAGYKQALLDYSLTVDESLIIKGKFMTDNGFELMADLFQRGIIPDGVVAQDDLIAFGVIKKIKSMELRVPEDIAVTGFYNVPMSEFSNPSLTTTEMNAFDVGVKACEILLDHIHSNRNQITKAIIPGNVIIRSSI